jgi:hypothetical protein
MVLLFRLRAARVPGDGVASAVRRHDGLVRLRCAPARRRLYLFKEALTAWFGRHAWPQPGVSAALATSFISALMRVARIRRWYARRKSPQLGAEGVRRFATAAARHRRGGGLVHRSDRDRPCDRIASTRRHRAKLIFAPALARLMVPLPLSDGAR